jgi:hypothetical protein
VQTRLERPSLAYAKEKMGRKRQAKKQRAEATAQPEAGDGEARVGVQESHSNDLPPSRLIAVGEGAIAVAIGSSLRVFDSK